MPLLAHRPELVAAQQHDIVAVLVHEESDVAFPAGRVVAPQHGDAAGARFVDRLAPFEPAARERRAGVGDAGLS